MEMDLSDFMVLLLENVENHMFVVFLGDKGLISLFKF